MSMQSILLAVVCGFASRNSGVSGLPVSGRGLDNPTDLEFFNRLDQRVTALGYLGFNQISSNVEKDWASERYELLKKVRCEHFEDDRVTCKNPRNLMYKILGETDSGMRNDSSRLSLFYQTLQDQVCHDPVNQAYESECKLAVFNQRHQFMENQLQQEADLKKFRSQVDAFESKGEDFFEPNDKFLTYNPVIDIQAVNSELESLRERAVLKRLENLNCDLSQVCALIKIYVKTPQKKFPALMEVLRRVISQMEKQECTVIKGRFGYSTNQDDNMAWANNLMGMIREEGKKVKSEDLKDWDALISKFLDLKQRLQVLENKVEVTIGSKRAALVSSAGCSHTLFGFCL